jgi:hypothetical protein
MAQLQRDEQHGARAVSKASDSDQWEEWIAKLDAESATKQPAQAQDWQAGKEVVLSIHTPGSDRRGEVPTKGESKSSWRASGVSLTNGSGHFLA